MVLPANTGRISDKKIMLRLLILILLLPAGVQAQLQLGRIFSDNMLLQRDKPVHVWGKCTPGEFVTVTLGKETKSTIVKRDSSWSIYLPPQKANSFSQRLHVTSGKEEINIQDVLIGDVWICIGQSNMEWPVIKEMHYKEEIKGSSQPLLRLYNPAYAGKSIFNSSFSDSVQQLLTPEKFYKGAWQACDSSSFKNMSAVAYYFGKKVTEETGVPIGLVNLSIGGAPLETFIDKNVLKNSDQFSGKVNGDWLDNGALPVWIRERGKQNVLMAQNVAADEQGKNHAFKPGFAYAAGIAPLLFTQIKGILCYQGESNAQEMERLNEYAALTKLMIDDYRAKWENLKLPFYYVQLSSIDTLKYKGQLWPHFRNEQRGMMNLIPNSGMAVCSDIGNKDDVHPVNKKLVGERLARWALNKTYHQNIIPSGPLPLKAIYKRGKVIIAFQYAGDGLKTSDSKPLRGFSTDGKHEAEAVVNGRKILIPASAKPEYIFYCWKPFSDGNLVNSDELPASTFKIEVK